MKNVKVKILGNIINCEAYKENAIKFKNKIGEFDFLDAENGEMFVYVYFKNIDEAHWFNFKDVRIIEK